MTSHNSSSSFLSFFLPYLLQIYVHLVLLLLLSFGLLYHFSLSHINSCRAFRRTSLSVIIAVKCPKTSPNEHRRFDSWIRNIKFHGHGFYCPGFVPRWGLQFQSIIFSPFCSTSYHPKFPILFAKNCTLPHKNHFLILFFKNICYFCKKGQFLKTWTWEKK